MKTLKKYWLSWMWLIAGGANFWAGFYSMDSWVCLISFALFFLCLYWAWKAKKDTDYHEKRMAEIQALIDQYSRR